MLLLKSIQWINKDKFNRNIYLKYELKKIIIKSLMYSNIYILKKKLLFDFYYKKFPYNSSISKYRLNCIYLGNSRSIIKNFKLSRHICKKYANYGFLNGLKKSSF